VANSIKDLTYRIRVSSKAQRVRLVISPSRGLEVVVPRNFNLGAVPALIAEHEQWIRQKIAKAQTVTTGTTAIGIRGSVADYLSSREQA